MSAIVYDFASFRKQVLASAEPPPIEIISYSAPDHIVTLPAVNDGASRIGQVRVDWSSWLDAAMMTNGIVAKYVDEILDGINQAEGIKDMPTFKIKVSQRVFYDVEVEAASAVEALRLVDRAIRSTGEDAPGLDEYPMRETDSGEFEVEEVQTDLEADAYADPEFVTELATILANQGA